MAVERPRLPAHEPAFGRHHACPAPQRAGRLPPPPVREIGGRCSGGSRLHEVEHEIGGAEVVSVEQVPPYRAPYVALAASMAATAVRLAPRPSCLGASDVSSR